MKEKQETHQQLCKNLGWGRGGFARLGIHGCGGWGSLHGLLACVLCSICSCSGWGPSRPKATTKCSICPKRCTGSGPSFFDRLRRRLRVCVFIFILLFCLFGRSTYFVFGDSDRNPCNTSIFPSWPFGYDQTSAGIFRLRPISCVAPPINLIMPLYAFYG